MKVPFALVSAIVATVVVSMVDAKAAAVPATGGWIEVHGQNCKVGGLPGPCTTAIDQVPYQVWDTVGSLTMLAGASVNANHLKADIDGTSLGGRVIASFVDVYTLHGPVGDPLSFSASLTVTGTRSTLANTAIGFGQPGRGSFFSGSVLHYHQASHPQVVNDVLTLALDDIEVGTTFSFSTIVDLLVNSGQKAFFGSTAVLAFTLPEGYFVSSLYGFSGPGSARLPDNTVPLPGSLPLVACAWLGWGVVRRRGRFASA